MLQGALLGKKRNFEAKTPPTYLLNGWKIYQFDKTHQDATCVNVEILS